MKSPARRNNRKRDKNAVVFPVAAKGRWLPDDTTRPQTFADRRKVANRNACRCKVALETT